MREVRAARGGVQLYSRSAAPLCGCAPLPLAQGLHYNPYFPGGAIAMPKMLVDGGVEYDDGASHRRAHKSA